MLTRGASYVHWQDRFLECTVLRLRQTYIFSCHCLIGRSLSMSGTKERKIPRKGLLVGLGIICIILVTCLGGAVAAYTLMINDKSNTISSLNNQISQLNSSVANLENQLASENSTINSLISQVANLQKQLLYQNTTYTVFGVLDGWELNMTLEKTVYSLGEPVNITLILTNISNQTTSFGLGYSNDFDFQVYNGTNNTLYKWSNRWLAVAHPYVILGETLNPGESLCEYVSWQQTCYNTGLSEGAPVLPGTYYIVGQIGPIYYGTNSTIETTPIQMTID